MKILTKHLLKSLLFPLIYCLLAFSLLFIISDLFDNFSDFLEAGIQPREIIYYYGMILPPVAVQILPACLLLAMLYGLSSLTRHSEIIAMRAGGVSISRIVLPFIGIGVVASLITGVINESLAPDFAYRSEQFLDYLHHHRREDIYFANQVALKQADHIWMIQKMNTKDYSLYNVELTMNKKEGSGTIRYTAEEALWRDGRWWFIDTIAQEYDEHGYLKGAPRTILHREMRELEETPQTFMAEVKDPEFLSSREMQTYIESKTGDISSDTAARLKVDLHSRLAAPFVCLIVTLIGVPVGAHTGRRGAFAGIMVAMCLFFVFFFIQLVAQSLGKNEIIPAWLGGWLPVILFGAGSPFIIHRMR